MTAVAAKAEVKMEEKVAITPAIGGGGGGNPNQNNNNNNNRGGGGRGRGRGQRGGGAGGGGPRYFGGRGGGGGMHQGGGGGGDRVERRPFHHDGFDGGPMNKRSKMGPMNPEQRIMEKLRGLNGPTADLPPTTFETKKFAANTRLYIGNISNEATESEIKALFTPFGEIDELFLNREKNFAFLKLDFRTNAEKARAQLDQLQVKNRPIKVRFAPAPVRVKVKNLSPMVSNELLELAFSIFGEIERALVFVDDKGKSIGEGFVDFTRKNNALSAHKFCTEKCYFITADLRPVVTENGEMFEVDEGLLEGNLNKREYGKDRELVYYKARELGPRLAEEGSFEHDYGTKWKALVIEFADKEKALKQEMASSLEKLQAEMEMTRYDYETEMLRQQLRQRELDQERQKLQWEQRMGFGGPGNGGFNQNGMGQNAAPDGLIQMDENCGENRPNPGGQPLAPPPMPPQGLMQHLQGGEEEMSGPGPTWASFDKSFKFPSHFQATRGEILRVSPPLPQRQMSIWETVPETHHHDRENDNNRILRDPGENQFHSSYRDQGESMLRSNYPQYEPQEIIDVEGDYQRYEEEERVYRDNYEKAGGHYEDESVSMSLGERLYMAANINNRESNNSETRVYYDVLDRDQNVSYLPNPAYCKLNRIRR